MTHPLTRRRFLSISAAFGLVAASAPAGAVTRWRGRALGAETSMVLTGLDEAQARVVFHAVEQELTRLENIFSLYRRGSDIVRLNVTGHLPVPSPEMLDLLSLCAGLHRASDGAFDPTVQPVWQALASGGDLARARAAVGWEHVRFDTGGVTLTRPGMALTLNGIAQGYITDRIAVLLRGRGLDNVLIDMGEIAAIGPRPDGRDWQAGIAGTDRRIKHHVALRDRALATSAAYATLLPADGKTGHIIDPTGTTAGPKQTLVSISAPLAAVADGLSTTLCLLDPGKARTVVAGFAGAEIELII